MDLQEDANIPTWNLTKIMHHAKSMQFSRWSLWYNNSFEHFFNKHNIEITSWREVKEMILTIMNCVNDQQIN